MLKWLMVFIVLFYTHMSYACPSPLGIAVNKATLDDVKKSHRILRSKSKAGAKYQENILDATAIQMDRLSSASIISNENNLVEAVFLTLDKGQFDSIRQTLSSKYKVISSKLPFVGDKNVRFTDGDCVIILEALHMSFSMNVSYLTNKFEKAVNDAIRNERKAKKDQEKSML